MTLPNTRAAGLRQAADLTGALIHRVDGTMSGHEPPEVKDKMRNTRILIVELALELARMAQEAESDE